MKENIDDIVNLIGKKLTNEATVEEQKLLDSWLAEKEENRVYFNQCKTLFEKASLLKEWQSFDTDAAWNNLKPKFGIKKQKEVTLFDRYWKVAASILIVMGIGFYSYTRLTKSQDVVAIKTEETVKQNTLPDGTLAFLNKRTSLAYEYNPVKKKRVVKLTGEAFFEIKKNESKPFIIEGEGLIIEDIGTSFNVEAYPESQIVEVFVKTGEVAMYTDQNPGIRIMPGETGVYNKDTKAFTKKLRVEDENVTSYKTMSFTFRQTRLADLVETLNEVYDKKIKIENEKLKDCLITVSFKDESIKVIAEVIAETLGLTVSETENEIVLHGEACHQ